MFCKANSMHWFINSLRLISTSDAFSSTVLRILEGMRIDMTSLSCFCGKKTPITHYLLVFIVFNML